ncbi:hypothetical protein AAMO2058_001383100 [Amorphochlora amoebiformis]
MDYKGAFVPTDVKGGISHLPRLPASQHRRLQLRPPGEGKRNRVAMTRARWENKFVFTDLDYLKPSLERGGRRIVVCVDPSEHSRHALDWCIRKLFSKNDDIHLLHVFDFAPMNPVPGPLDTHAVMDSVVEQNRRLEMQGEEAAVRMIKNYQRRCVQSGVLYNKPSVTVMRGDCNRELVDYAESHGADLLVVASRGLGAVRRFLLGSVSGFCVHNSKVPVLVVKEDGEAEAMTSASVLSKKKKNRVVQDIE